MDVKTPLIVINYKIYPQSFGDDCMRLSKLCNEISEETGRCIVVCPPATEIYRVAQEVEIPVWGQGADAVELGGRTGHISVECLKEAGASGVLINHSEKRLKIADIGFLVEKCKNHNMVSCVCSNDTPVSVACAALNPDFVAVEPPELIGGDISVTTASPEIVSKTVKFVKDVNKYVKVLCGAGVKTGEDVRKAIELGTAGVLLASGVVKARNPEKVIRELVAALD